MRSFPTPADGSRLHVDDFPDGLVPFVGDPKRARGIGDLLQILSALAAFVFVLLTVPNAVVWSLARKGEDLTVREVVRLGEALRLADDGRLALIGVGCVGLLLIQFVRARRPRKVLVAEGEAFVEVALARICPRSRAIAIGVLAAIGAAAVLLPTRQLDSFESIAGMYAAKGLGCACLAVALVLVFRLARASRRHLEIRLERSVGLAPTDVPFVAPDRPGTHR